MLTVALLIVLLACLLLANVAFLWLGARWLKSPQATLRRAVAAWLCLLVPNVVFGLLPEVVEGMLPAGERGKRFALLIFLVLLVVQLVVASAILRRLFTVSGWRALGIFLCSLIPVAVGLGGLHIVIHPYVLEAYIMTSNSNMPALAGSHRVGVCPYCGGPMLLGKYDDSLDPTEGTNATGICSRCLKIGKCQNIDPEVLGPDRFFVEKFRTPRRWDLVVYVSPDPNEPPGTKFVKRLVGLPGEVVFIRDGAIWVNGVKLSLPDSIAGMQFSAALGDRSKTRFGDPEHPWRLQGDEYCLLGDFYYRSGDSRFFGPVKRSAIEGVVSLRYWPLGRWRVFR